MNARMVIGLIGLFSGYLGLAWWVPIVDDELYYWCWSRELQLSYFDHAPLTAYLIRLVTELFGDGRIAIRLPACIASTAVIGMLYSLMRSRGVMSGVLISPLFTYGGVLITPDTPLILFWTAYLMWLTAVHRQIERCTLDEAGDVPGVSLRMWVLGGVILGLGGLGKYTMVLAVPAAGLSFLLLGRTQLRRWLPCFVLHGVIALCIVSPVFIHNFRVGFAPLRFQWEHAASVGNNGLKSLGDFVGVQIVLCGTLPLVLLPWVLYRFRRLAGDARLRPALCLYLLPYLFFLWKATRGPLEGNWAMASYLGFWPLAATWFEETQQHAFWRWSGRLAFTPSVLATIFLSVHLIWPIPLIEPNKDRITRFSERIRMAEDVAKTVATDPLPLYSPYYQRVAELRYLGVDARQEPGVTRPSQFTQGIPDRMTDHAAVYYLSEFDLPSGHADGFKPREHVRTFRLNVRGEKFDDYVLWVYRKP